MPPEGPTQAAEKQIFCWPSDEAGGRVWVLRISMSSWRSGDDDNFWSTEVGFEAMLDLLKDCDGESEMMDLLAMRIIEQEDMDGVCNVLREAGGIYYKDLKQCPELVKLGLLEPVNGRNDLLPPQGPGDKWKWRRIFEDTDGWSWVFRQH